MSTVFEFLSEGGPVMIPLLGASVLTISCGLERALFWSDLLKVEGKVVNEVLNAAQRDLNEAGAIANQYGNSPIGRFLSAPLKLKNASPETFRLALEAAADREFIKMRKGDKLLETVVGVAPLLGLLGTVMGLIKTFYSLDIGGSGGTDGATAAAAGIGEALIATASGMVVAILALLILRVMVTLQAQQTDFFSEAGNQLELIYRQNWYEPALLAADQPIHPQLVDGRLG